MLDTCLYHNNAETFTFTAIQGKIKENEGNSFGAFYLSSTSGSRYFTVQVRALPNFSKKGELKNYIFRATHVPVGDDQLQQIQLAQHLAQSFNFKFGNTFPPCHSMTVETACRIRSLRDPTKKMSKSDPDGKSSIFLADKPEEILEKVKKAVTDFTSEVTYDPEKRLGVSNLISIHSLASGLTPEQICMDAKGLDTGKYKLRVADALIAHLNPIRLKIEDYLKHPEYIEDILKKGAENATEIASQTLSEVRSKVGFLDLNNRQKEEFISKKAC